MQIFSRSPRGGPAPKLAAEAVERFDDERRRAGIEPLAVHAPYIINLASPEPAMWRFAVRLYREECERAARLGARYLVTHVGSHRGTGEAGGIARVARALSRALRGTRSSVMVLLENTAGSGQGLGESFEQLAAIRSAVEGNERVGICLDTAHLFAAGYPIHTADGLEETLDAVDRVIGLRRVKLIHLNDSKVPFGSRVDRHWHIGRGHIGREAFRRIVTHRHLKTLPCILETPKETEAEDRRNLAAVRALVTSRGRYPARPAVA
jgi:deoxyribonuclease-4